MKKKLLFIWSVILAGAPLLAASISSKSGTTGFAFLKISRSARAAAMGECYAGLADDVNAIYYNPAGLAGASGREITASHILWFESISKSSLGYLHPPFKFGTLAAALDLTAIPFESRKYEDDNNFERGNLANFVLSLAYGRKISSRLSIGGGLKYASEDLSTKNKSDFALDLGGLYSFNNTLNAGLSLQNMGASDMPMNIRLGAAKKLLADNALTALGDFYWGIRDGTRTLGIGGEYKLSDLFYPRL
ncbi:MAG: PorV/PorQ family protein, partial [Elusimicrobia bacterium]|nr:PorV/PorQ family protein [Elusimicrobiota bacterium]